MKSYLRAGASLAILIITGTLGIFAVAGGFCLLGPKCTALAYSSMAMNLGMVAFGLGGVSIAGAAMIGRNTNYQIARTAGVDNSLERTQRDIWDSNRRLLFTLVVAGSGVISMLVALWLWLHLS